ncbi:MAG: hypothetical protein U0229_20545 [Anaeromyxobacter sp.]
MNPPPPPPDWITGAARAFARELRAYAGAAAGALVRPRTFGRAWAEGRSAELNPFGFLATSAAILSGAQAIAGMQGPPHLAGQVLAALVPYVHWALLGSVAHLVLRAFGSGQPYRASLAMALYVGGGPGLLLTLLTYAVSFGLVAATGAASVDAAFAAHPRLSTVLFYGLVGAQVTYLALALAGAHRARPRLAVAGVLLALVETAVVYGVARPPGSVGVHLALLWLDRPRFVFRF